jgi:hypothetical protein
LYSCVEGVPNERAWSIISLASTIAISARTEFVLHLARSVLRDREI